VRHVLEEARIHEGIRGQISDRNRDIVEEVERAIAEHDMVVVGMKTNPHPKRAVGALEKAGIAYKYLEYGSYTNSWRRRNALKMWTGWPTLPMVFVKGTLIGGANETIALIESGDLQRMLD
jgi:glutaredoxin-related protein